MQNFYSCPKCHNRRDFTFDKDERHNHVVAKCNSCGFIAPRDEFELRLNTGQQKIPGYRDLTTEELELIADIKMHGNKTQELVDRVEAILDAVDDHPRSERRRWLSIARTDLQKAFMPLIRSIANPGGF